MLQTLAQEVRVAQFSKGDFWAPSGAFSNSSREARHFPWCQGIVFSWPGPALGCWRQAQASHSLLSPHSRLWGGGNQYSKRPQNKWASYLISQPGLLSDHYIMAMPVASPAGAG